MDPDAGEAFKKMIGEPGAPVPSLAVADIKKMRADHQELDARHPGQQYAVGLEVWRRIFGPETDISAVCYRCATLWMLERWLQPLWAGGELSEVAFKAAATMELKRMAVGVPQSAMPLIEVFLAQVYKEAA